MALLATMKVDGFLKNENKIKKENEVNGKMGGRKWEKRRDERDIENRCQGSVWEGL